MLAATLVLCAPVRAQENGANSVLAIRHPESGTKRRGCVIVEVTPPPAIQSAMGTAVADFGMNTILRRMVQLTEEIRDSGYNVPIWCGLIANKFPTE